jgi:hypothetical protein
MFDQLTSAELDRAHDAAGLLLAHADALQLDQHTRIKLDTLHADLLAEQEDRGPRPVTDLGDWGLHKYMP